MKSTNNSHPIDIVIYWVDSSDEEWLSVKNSFHPKNQSYSASTDESRFRDWDNLFYIFRGIEEYMPWVRKIHFITWGHLPKWLDKNHPKLNIVKHTDFIPQEFLPTFNSHTIELNIHRIKDLSENFIVFNDDTFVINQTKPSDFFINDIPRDMAILNPYPAYPNGIAPIVMNNLEIINKYFTISDIKKNIKKWLSYKYGPYILRTLLFSNYKSIIGIFQPHIQVSYKKETFCKLWSLEPEVLRETCESKFREKHNLNIWVMRDWQLCSGNFIPRSYKFGKSRSLPKHLDEILSILKSPKSYKLLCINDSVDLESIEEVKGRVNDALEKLFPEKSSFEL